jgi:phosphatidylglycerol:prolipoprotein diacylglycerol transferase
LGLVFSHPDNHLTPQGIPLHPTQLYESAFALLLFILLQLLFLHRKPRVTGGLMAIYLAAYAVFRFMVEFIRADPRGELIAGILTPSQTISLAMLVLSVWLLFGKKK